MADDNKPQGNPVRSSLDTLKQIFDNLVTLNIVTAVGDADITPAEKGTAENMPRITLKPGAKVIWTAIDMLQGDITTTINPDFAGEAGKELRDFHSAREQQGHAIIKNNIEALEKLLTLMQRLATHEKNG